MVLSYNPEALQHLKIPPSNTPLPVLKMKRLSIKFRRIHASGSQVVTALSFANMDDRTILSVTIPPKEHAEFADVSLDPNAKLDEIASVIAFLVGDLILSTGV